MPWTVTEFETTPNPNALKCRLDQSISTHPRSFLNPTMAKDDPIAHALFTEAGAVCVLMNGDWITVNKHASADWRAVKSKVREILARAE